MDAAEFVWGYESVDLKTGEAAALFLGRGSGLVLRRPRLGHPNEMYVLIGGTTSARKRNCARSP